MALRQVAEMHLDERLEKSREVIGKQIAVGQQKVSSAYNRLWAEMEAMREAQRKRQEEQKLQAEKDGKPVDEGRKCKSPNTMPRLDDIDKRLGKAPQAPDLAHAQANIQAAGTRAGAYLSSWGTWASEKRKGWGASKTPVSSPPASAGPTTADMKRAEEFKREKERTVGNGTSVESTESKRESLFFDAEKDEAIVDKN